MWLVSGMDTSVWSVATAFEPAPRLDIFGDKSTTEARRRCRPGDDASDEEKLLFDLHYKVTRSIYVGGSASGWLNVKTG